MHKNAIHDLRCRKILASDDVILTAEIELFRNTKNLYFRLSRYRWIQYLVFDILNLEHSYFARPHRPIWSYSGSGSLALVLELLPHSVFTNSENWINTICSLLFIGWWWWYYLYQMVTSLMWTHNLWNLRMLNSIWSMFTVCWRYVPTCSFANCNIILFNSK